MRRLVFSYERRRVLIQMWSGRCWLRARCRCSALPVPVLISTLAVPNCGAQAAPTA
jgi:hypothetical protein